VDAKERQRRRQRGPERQKRSKAAHRQETQKAQPKRGVTKERSGEPLEC